jgi:hypothetical protein
MLSLVSNQQYNVSCASSSLFEKVRWSHEACKRPVSHSHQASWPNRQGQLWMLDYCKKGNPWFSLYPTSYDHENKSKPLQEKDYHWDQRRGSWSSHYIRLVTITRINLSRYRSRIITGIKEEKVGPFLLNLVPLLRNVHDFIEVK